MEHSKYKVSADDRELSLELLEPGKAIIGDRTISYDMAEIEPSSWHVLVDHKSYNVRLVERDDTGKTVTMLVNNRRYTLTLRDRFDELLEKLGMSAGADAHLNELKAPMPGLVVDVIAQPGSAVEKGDTLLILEAMKMENVIKAVAAATVKSAHVEKGQTVEKNQLLMSFE